MPSELFVHHFPEVGKAETRSLTLPAATEGVPAGLYGFVEVYCTEQGCDCRRVLLQVLNPDAGIVAVISYGFDRHAPMAGPFVDPMNPSAPYAEGLLTLTREIVLSDPDYVARLERHYHMMKAKTNAPSPAVRAAARRKQAKGKKKRR